jgi:hypothetical protein
MHEILRYDEFKHLNFTIKKTGCMKFDTKQEGLPTRGKLSALCRARAVVNSISGRGRIVRLHA